jgi:Tol biopolymer transport system component
MALEPGTRFGTYEITGQLGVGGMGEVYRATDTTLERQVAIKVLPQTFAADADRIARFEQEAKLLASLNHVNIAQVYGLEKSEGVTAIVMELVEGPTLADRIAEGPIRHDEALNIGLQILDALDAAHSQSIVHRDLKPANIKLRADGVVKVLDFGIAKAFEPAEFLSGPVSPVMTTPVTQAGIILGTAAYMSPEQARGKAIDQRTDVWAFGCVLYEMLTGQPVFGGEDVTITLARVLERDTDMRALPEKIPLRVRHAIELCLQKDPKNRLHAAGDVRLALTGAFEAGEQSMLTGTGSRAARWLRTGTMVVAGVIAGVAGSIAFLGSTDEAPPEVIRLAEVLGPEQAFTAATTSLLAISPDGGQLVYAADGVLYLRNLDEWDARPISGSEFAVAPFFSPDGQWIGFRGGGDAQLKKVAVTGGAAVTLAPSLAPQGQPFWMDDGTIIWADTSGVQRVSENGGTPETIAETIDQFYERPQLLPDGDSLLMCESDGTERNIVTLSLSSGEKTFLLAGESPRYVEETGHIVYGLDGVVLAVPFNVETLTVTGGSVPLVEGVQPNPAQFAISDTGTLAYIPGGATASNRTIGIVNRDGSIERLAVPPKVYASPRISPDGRQLLVQSQGPEGGIIWLYDMEGTSAIQQLTFAGDNHRAVWSPDSSQIVFSSNREGTMSLYRMPADGSRGAERITTAEPGTSHWMGSFTPDGQALVFNLQRELATDWDIATVPIDGGEPEMLYDAPDTIYLGAELSPDGSSLAYSSGVNAGDVDVYIEPFPATGSRRRISQSGGYWPLWSPDLDELFYRPVSNTAGITLHAVDIQLDPFNFSNERTHAVQGFQVVSYYRDYDVMPDGERLVMMFPDVDDGFGTRAQVQINIVKNWIEELKERVPVP